MPSKNFNVSASSSRISWRPPWSLTHVAGTDGSNKSYVLNQDKFLEFENFTISDSKYKEIFDYGRRKSRTEGIDKVMREKNVNIIVAPSDSQLYLLAALAGELPFLLCL